jgi:hypothetical protein
MNRVDRSQRFIDEGRSLVSDPVRPAPPTPPPPLDLSDDDFVPDGLRAWAGRSDNGVHVQGLVDAEGTTYVTVVLGGQCETREVARGRALDVFLHPFATDLFEIRP